VFEASQEGGASRHEKMTVPNRKILLVDDHPLYHEGLASALLHAGGTLRLVSSETVDQGLACVAADPDIELVLLDLMLPGSSGLDAITRFGVAQPLLPRVLVSGRLDAGIIETARRHGASGFIAKSWPLARIVASIEGVLAGGVDFSMLDELPSAEKAPAALSQRQCAVLDMLARGKSNKEMARSLQIAERTVRAHLTGLFQALGASSRVQALLQAQRLGLIEAADMAGDLDGQSA
jgi:DNA-binding NarL/FixJ family response regulator